MVNIEAVVLAAGYSSRTGPGIFKMELEFRGKTLLEHAILSLQPFCSRVFVVVGHRSERVRNIVKSYPQVVTVNNPDYRSGMFTSVLAGVAQVKSEWFFFTPGDYPLITEVTCRSLLGARAAHPGRKVFIPVFNGRKGHPVLMVRQLVPALLAEPKNSNLRLFIDSTGFVPVRVSDSGILTDIDTMEDYRVLLRNLKMPEK